MADQGNTSAAFAGDPMDQDKGKGRASDTMEDVSMGEDEEESEEESNDEVR